MKYLYRGVSSKLFNQLEGKLIPKKEGRNFPAYACAGDPHAVCGSGIEAGESSINTVILHQWEQAGIPTSGVSTTPLKKRALHYALPNKNIEEGYIFKLSVSVLTEKGVSIHRVNDLVPHPSVPEDDEHILVAQDFGQIPNEAIVDITGVSNSCSL